MSETTFIPQPSAWAADPNAPAPKCAVRGSDLFLQFFSASEGPPLVLVFENASRFRFTAVNDEGWYSGQCRFSHSAPAWGAFYRLEGDTSDDLFYAPWVSLGGIYPVQQHYLYYFRDETFECIAGACAECVDVPDDLEWQEPEVVFNAKQQHARLERKPFQAIIEHGFVVKEKGLGQQLTHIKGMPCIGQTVRFGDHVSQIFAIGKNSTDHQPVSFRDCLGGLPCPPYGSILVRFKGEFKPGSLFGLTIAEVGNDV